MKQAFSLLLLGLGLLFGLLSFYAYQYFVSPLTIAKEGYFFELKRGETLSHLSYKLKNDALIENTLLFRVYVRLTGLDKKVHAGEYYLAQGENLLKLISNLKHGSTMRRSFTFVEGWSYRQLFEALKSDESITWQYDENTIKQELGLENLHLEGQFFADTYFYNKGESAINLLKASHKKLNEILEQEWFAREDNLPFNSAYEALILASIVEKETGLASERPLIAGVFINRLRKGMRLKTDPTVIYGLGETYRGNITKKHLQEYTEYNTYHIPALPPTPIALVGRESIKAVMHPQVSNYLYFVAKGDGSHYFSPTYEDHKKFVELYQKNRVSNYRSAPSQ